MSPKNEQDVQDYSVSGPGNSGAKKEMNRIYIYRPDFLRLWDAFDVRYGPKGSKRNAEKEFIKLKATQDDVNMMVNAVEAQKRNKHKCIVNNLWWEKFQHVERWLKNQRWEDEICEPIATESKSERITRELQESLSEHDQENIRSIEADRPHSQR